MRVPLPPLAHQAVLRLRRLASMQQAALDVARIRGAGAASGYALASGRNRSKNCMASSSIVGERVDSGAAGDGPQRGVELSPRPSGDRQEELRHLLGRPLEPPVLAVVVDELLRRAFENDVRPARIDLGTSTPC
jgi:hypothetical protein